MKIATKIFRIAPAGDNNVWFSKFEFPTQNIYNLFKI